MRLWSIHPSYLDARGLVALWREGLLAQKVLLGETRGYRHHPQLVRFKKTVNPVGAIAGYLESVVKEADARGYNFDRNRIVGKRFRGKIAVTRGQVRFEFSHLLKKLKHRDPEWFNHVSRVKRPRLHPAFTKISGEVEDWERT